MLVSDAETRELGLELVLVNLLEDILETSVIDLQDRVLGRKVHRILAHGAVVERGAGEIADRIVQIVHRHRDAGAGELEHLLLDHLAVVAFETDREAALAGRLEVGRPVLVAVGVAADDDRLRPAGHEPRHVPADDRLAEDDPAQNVADGAVRAPPHFLEIEFLDPRFVRRDRRAFDADAAGLDRLRRVDRNLIVGRVAVLDRQVEIHELYVEIGMNQLLADKPPDDARHLVAVEFDDRICDLDLGHRANFRWRMRGGKRRCAIAPALQPAKLPHGRSAGQERRTRHEPFA